MSQEDPIFRRVTEFLVKTVLRGFLQFIYRVRVIGLENYPDKNQRYIIIANHISFLDGMFFAAFLPDHLTFVVHSYYSSKKILNFFFRFVNIISIDQMNPYIIKDLVKDVKNGAHCVIFPEGKISITGSLMKIYEGPGLIADRADALLLPIRIEGPQYTPFTRMQVKTHKKFFPQITLTILPPTKINCPPEIRGRMRRKIIAMQVANLMENLIFTTTNYQQTLFAKLIEARNKFGKRKKVLEDLSRTPLSYQQIITKSFVLGRYYARNSKPNEFVGILLPTSSAAVVSMFALYSRGRIPAILNFTTSAKILAEACSQANIQRIYTSRQFVEKAKLMETIQILMDKDLEVIFLEDIKPLITMGDKLIGLLCGLFPSYAYKKTRSKSSYKDPAVLLFTSGSEALPKAVLLSHENLLANQNQLFTRFDFNKNDITLNALPIFHSFGFMGAIMPLFCGSYLFCYPSPLHYRVIPEICYDINATLIFGTDTFLRGYAKVANAYDFYRVRYVLSGGEPVHKDTRELWHEKFGIRIIEGYGITETSPVIACNTPMQFKSGTVGRLVPGIEYKLETVEGIDDANSGRLWVKGPSIMKGYLALDKSGNIIPPAEGWYDTGDIVQIDELGFITILGRAKRFAKISGEMISLNAVENYIQLLRPEKGHAVINLPDSRKGEMLILVTESKDLTRETIIEFYNAQQLSMLMLPKKIIFMDELPRTAAGKLNYPAISAFVLDEISKISG